MKASPNPDSLEAAWRVALESDDRVTKLRIEAVLDGLGRAALALTDLESDAQPEDGEETVVGKQAKRFRIN